jgi:hypothetical protein
MGIDALLEFLGRRLARFLTTPVRGYEPKTTFDSHLLARCVRPADVLLVDGHTRVAVAIKYLTQSTWSHAALYVGPIPHRRESSGEPHVLIEADVRKGVISAPLSKYRGAHTRICRPIGLGKAGRRCVVEYAVARIGLGYDVKNIVDLLRYLLPTPPVPVRFRRRLIAFGSGSPTRAICSTLIAQAFQSVRYPILPSIEPHALSPGSSEQARQEILHIRHHSLFTPHDFDISPYFAIIKPTIAAGFDYRSLRWSEEGRMPEICRSHAGEVSSLATAGSGATPRSALRGPSSSPAGSPRIANGPAAEFALGLA